MTTSSGKAEENKEFIRRFIETTVNAHDLETIAASTDNERLVESFTRFFAGFSDVRLDVEWMIAEGDKCPSGVWRAEPTTVSGVRWLRRASGSRHV